MDTNRITGKDGEESHRIGEMLLLGDAVNKPMISKLIAEKEDCSIVFMAFVANHEFKAHTAVVDVIIVGLEGEAIVIFDDSEMKIKSGTVLTIPANVKHAVKALTAFKMLLIK